MSGGVDSSVAAKLLLEQGYEVAGVFLHFWKDPETSEKSENRCCSLESFKDAKDVAAKIGIPLFSLDYSEPFKESVVDYFLQEYSEGRTPNPCVACNRKIKIGRLLDQALALGYDYLATGHYLRLRQRAGKFELLRAKDQGKDQTYFLYTFKQEQLSHLLFPLGAYVKSETRQMAEKFSLKVASKPESQDICFLSGDHNNFLKRHLDLKEGEIILQESGENIGRHSGLPLYTIGQRRGLPDGRGPYYVSGFDYSRNILYVVKNWQDQSLFGEQLLAKDINWLSGQPPKNNFLCQAVIRYGHQAVDCRLKINSQGEAAVSFLEPQRAITPGQSVVFYRGEKMLGGGIIV